MTKIFLHNTRKILFLSVVTDYDGVICQCFRNILACIVYFCESFSNPGPNIQVISSFNSTWNISLKRIKIVLLELRQLHRLGDKNISNSKTIIRFYCAMIITVLKSSVFWASLKIGFVLRELKIKQRQKLERVYFSNY